MDMGTARQIFDHALPELISAGSRGSFGLVTKSGAVEVFPSGEEARARGIREYGLSSDFFADVIDDYSPDLVVASLTLAE